MFEKSYLQSICFLGLLSIFGIYLGYLGLIYPIPSLLAIISSIILTWGLTKNIETKKTDSWKVLSLILFIFLIILISTSLPNLVFPHGAGDFQNHARSVRLIVKVNSFGIPQSLPLIFPHKYPQVYYGIASMFYSLYPHTYIVNSLFPILLEVLSLAGIFFIARNFFGEKIALLSTFISGFAITNLFILEQGFFPYLLGQFFFITSVYLFLIDEKGLLILANVGLLSYPHIFLIYLIFILLETLKSKELSIFYAPIISFIILAPETFGIFYKIFFTDSLSGYAEPFRGILLLKGGILSPPLISLLIFGFAIIGIYFERRKKDFINVNLSILIMMVIVMGAFGYAFLFGYTDDIRLLYMLVKFFYLLVFPLSIAVAVGIDKIIKKDSILAVLLLIYFFYFAGYSFTVLPKKANFPGEAYEIFEKMDTLPGKFKVGVDPDLISNKGWKPRFPYKSLVDVPDTGYQTGEIARVELNKALQFHWASYTSKGGLKVINSKREEVIKYSKEGVDYYISSMKFSYPIIVEEGRVKVYRVTSSLLESTSMT